MRYWACLILTLMPTVAWADENAAIALALKDALSLPIQDRHCIRYVWVPDGSHEAMQVTSLVMNTISRATVIARPLPLDKTLIRVDLRHYAGKDLLEFKYAWGCLTFDPKFSLLITKDTLKFSELVVKSIKVTGQDGKESVITTIDGSDVVKIVSPHIDQKNYAALSTILQSQAPIVDYRYLLIRALTTIQDKGVYATIYGGLYYDFTGIKTGAKKGTDEDVLFEQLGVGDVANGITATKIFDRLRSDQRIAVFRSGITGRPRRADFLRTLVGLDSQSIISVTHDIRQQDIDIGTHPVMNLLAFKDAAREVIFEKTNGLHGFALFDGEGKRQDEVPPDIAPDHLVPAPHPTRLQPAIGCIRCHNKEGGWRTVHNDAKKLLTNLLDIFPNRKHDDIDRLAGLYAGDVERKLLPRGRDDYASATLLATGPWKAGKKDQTDIVAVTGEYVAKTYSDYWYSTVDAKQALIEMGLDPKDALAKMLPPVPLIVNGAIPEDPRIGALLAGLSINRSDWDLIYSFVASRRIKK